MAYGFVIRQGWSSDGAFYPFKCPEYSVSFVYIRITKYFTLGHSIKSRIGSKNRGARNITLVGNTTTYHFLKKN